MSENSKNLSFLMSLIQSYQYSQAILTAVELGVFQAIESNSLTSKQLSKKLKCSNRGLEYLLVALESLNMIKSYKKGQQIQYVANSSIIKCFGYDGELIHWTLHHKKLYELWKDLSCSIKSGLPLLKNTHDLNVENYVIGLFEEYSLLPYKIHEIIEFKGKIDLLDIGGGAGQCSIFAALDNPNLRATIIDKEEVTTITKKIINKYQLENRIVAYPGDILISQISEEYDIILLSNILHGKNEQEALKIISKAYESLKSNGRIIINELIDLSNPEVSMFNLTMLICTQSGHVWNKYDLDRILHTCGFKKLKWSRLTQIRCLLEGQK